MDAPQPDTIKAEIALDPSLPFGPALAQLSGVHIDWINQHLAEADADPVTAVHESRKSLRRIRAYLRLVRSEVPAEYFDRANLLLRDSGRELSEARSAAVAVDTATALLDLAGSAGDGADWQELRHRLIARRDALQTAALDNGLRTTLPETLAEVGKIWERSVGRIENGFEALRPNLLKVYSRGRREARRAAEAGSTAVYHRWRKRVRYLRFQLEALTPLDPESLGPQAEAVEELAELLGEEHDLAEFSELLLGDDGGSQSPLVRRLAASADYRNRELKALADALGERVYESSPSGFVADMAAVWERSAAFPSA